MEAIVKDKLLDHLITNNLITPCQHGFLKKHSTSSQQLEFSDDFTNANEHGDCIDICLIDFRRAFNSFYT